ncbi:flagellar export protein FliJ [Kaistia soli DSM 19436]|uniref:Flagellar export protein FliJ n=1 Tax=Kaistia soli DSM 19436 TaxID=1122133 RepID=A0A1M5MHY1_9HYPH|nr:flagellar export protein FliJ [Kaistia soli]SHG76948.1 flagellar export protein FliJ [Kaistia soli DSM 19436]
MKSRESLIRLKRFQAEEKRRRVQQIELMIAEFERMARDLEDQIKIEQERSGIRDQSHFAYPTFAKAASQRRDNLLASAQELQTQLETAQDELLAATDELRKHELLAERDQERERGTGDADAKEPARRGRQTLAGERRSV